MNLADELRALAARCALIDASITDAAFALADRAKVLEKDAERIDWLGQVKHGVTINPPGEHGGELSNWLVTVEGESGWAESEDEGPTIRAAIDAAMKDSHD